MKILSQLSATSRHLAFGLLIATAAGTDALAQGSDLHVQRTRDFITGGPKGGPVAPAQRAIRLRNEGATPIDWSASTSVAWLDITSAAGTLAPGATTVLHAVVDQALAATFPKGQRSGSISIHDETQGTVAANLETALHIGFTIDNQRNFRLNGKPFIPIAVWAQPPQDSWAAFHADLGINVMCGNGNSDTATNPAFLDAARNHGMHGMLNFDSTLIDHPGLLAWYLPDEPDLHHTPVAQVQATFDSWKSQDPENLIMVNLTGNFYWDSNFGNNLREQEYFGYTSIPDWVGFDMYPMAGYNRPEWVYIPGAASRFMSEHYLAESKPVWTWIETVDTNNTWVPLSPGPTPEQTRFEVWDSLIQGSRAIGYFTICFDPWSWAYMTPEMITEMRRTNRQVKQLTPLLVADESNFPVSVTEQSGQSFNYTVRQRGTRAIWIFVTNADMHQPYREANMTFSFQQQPQSVTVFGENRSITPSGTTFSDSFEPLEVHIYRVRF